MAYLTVKYRCPKCNIKGKLSIAKLGNPPKQFKTEKEWQNYRKKQGRSVKKKDGVYIDLCWQCDWKNKGYIK